MSPAEEHGTTGRRRADAATTGGLRGATAVMAAGTVVSRFSGVLRVIALAYALGGLHLADAYNLANTTPNMLYDVVLGGVLSATFIPVFVHRLSTRSDQEAWHAISAVVSLAGVVLVTATVVFWLAAPVVIDAFLALDHSHAGLPAHTVALEKAVATTLLRWFVPQVALYGLIAISSALLNTRRRFASPMWVPIANNVICVAVLVWFHHVSGGNPTLAGATLHRNQLVLLGAGTTAGVALQALLMLPGLRGNRRGQLRFVWDPGHEAVRTTLRLGAWTLGFVAANQVALFVVLALAVSRGGGSDPVSSYTYAYTFMQMPYAVVAVSVMSAVTPDLAERWSRRDTERFRLRLAGGLRAVLAVIIPAAIAMVVLARPGVALLLAHGSTTVSATADTRAALALFGLGLPGFCLFLYLVRALQAMQETRTAFWLYLVENGINVVLALALVGPMGVRGLALSLSIAYSAAAVCAVVVLRRWVGPLGSRRLWSPLWRVGAGGVVMGAVTLVMSNLSSSTSTVGLFLRVVGGLVFGGAAYLAVVTVLGRRSENRSERRPAAGARPLVGPAGFEGRARSGHRGEIRLVGGGPPPSRPDPSASAPPGSAPLRPVRPRKPLR